MDAMNAVKRKEAHDKGMKRIYKHGLTFRNKPMGKRVQIYGDPIILEALQRKAAALKKSFSRFVIEACSYYTPKVPK